MRGRNKEELSRDTLADVSLIIFGAPREDFSAKETADLTQYLNSGGRVLLLTTDGGEYDDYQYLRAFLNGSVHCALLFTDSLLSVSRSPDLSVSLPLSLLTAPSLSLSQLWNQLQ
jgi:hypothetical protein